MGERKEQIVELSKAAAAAILLAAAIPALMLWTLLAWGAELEGDAK